MPKTVVGLFDTFSEAQSAVQDLVEFGVRREEISLVARDEHGVIGEANEVGATGAAEGAGAGAVGGSVVGGALGLLIGAGLLVIPGIGPVLAAGPIAAAVGSAAAAVGAGALGAGIGAAAGGLLGSLMGAGITEGDAEAYVEGVRRGGTLLSVSAADNETDDVRQILVRNGAVDMDVKAAEWRSSGWNSDGYAAGNVSMGSAVDSHATDADTLSEGTRRAPHFAGEDATGGAFSSSSGRQLSSDQRASLAGDERNAGVGTSDQLGAGRGPRIYDRPGRGPSHDADAAPSPAHGDYARGMREEAAPDVEPDYARGERDAQPTHDAQLDGETAGPHHGDYARGMRGDAEAVQPDFARGQRGYEVYDTDFINHYQSLTGAGGQPYDYYKPGYQFGYEMANDKSYSHDSWETAERDARPRWEQEARGSWEEFKQTIRYGWEKARGRA